MLVTDVIMPGLSGRALVDRLREDYPDLRVLFMSGYTDDVVVHHGVVTDGVAFLQKPFNAADLGRMVRAVLAAPPSGRQA
jgi:FixJ family two-component response regulator